MMYKEYYEVFQNMNILIIFYVEIVFLVSKIYKMDLFMVDVKGEK